MVAYRGHAGRSLLFDPDIRLLNFDRGDAYTRHLQFLSLLRLPEGVVDFTQNIPREDVYLLAPKAQLVARKDVHPALSDRLLLPPFYQWRMRSRIFRWYDRVMEIDSEMFHGDVNGRRMNSWPD